MDVMSRLPRHRTSAAATLMMLASLSSSCSSASDAQASVVSLDVRFRLTDLEYKPIPQQHARIVVGRSGDWQSASSGKRFATDQHGEHRYQTATPIEKVSRKRPTNFLDSLLTRPQLTDHLQIAAELEYASRRWLYVVQAYRFPDGDVLQDGLAIYAPDAQGRFVEKAVATDDGWQIAGLGGLIMTGPGLDVWNLTLQPDERSPARWTLDLAFRRAPPPVRR